MRKLLKAGIVLFIVVHILQFGSLWCDKCTLHDGLIRLHVVANSDSEEDQAVKLKVKDAVVSYLQPIMGKFTDKSDAYVYLKSSLKEISEVAVKTLRENGFREDVHVSLTEETFTTRTYDTFTLPSGVYDALRIRIGKGEGENWWCVTFPSLCLPNEATEFKDMAVSAGFSEDLVQTVANNGDYELRFYFLDALGKLENLFFVQD